MNISETVRVEVWFQTTNREWPMGNPMTSRDPERSNSWPQHDQYLENSWRCYLATIANYYISAAGQYDRLS